MPQMNAYNAPRTLKDILMESLRRDIKKFIMIIALIVICLIFNFLTDGIFLKTRNLSNLFLQSTTVAILAIGMVLILVTLNIDLSVGSLVGFIGAVAAVLQVNYSFGPFTAILLCVLVGLLIGLWHGIWIAYLGVPAFIVTLASMMIFRGGILGLTGGATVSNMPPEFAAIGQSYLSPAQGIMLLVVCLIGYIGLEIKRRVARVRYGFYVLPMWMHLSKIITISLLIIGFFSILMSYKGVPYAVVLVLIVLVIFTFIAENTTFGRHLYAIGGNAEAAKLSGINIKAKILYLYMLMGVISAIAGMVYLARLNAATAQAGLSLELDAIASAVIGGTSLLGGEGYIFGAVVGALIMASLDNGMSLMNLDVTWQYVIKGLVLLLAVWADMMTRKRN